MDSNCNSHYKKTEIGFVPDDWGMKLAEDFCQRVTDGTHDTPKKREEGHYLVTSRHIKEGGLDFDNAYFINDRDFDETNKRSKVSQWDVIFSMIGTIGEIYLEKSDKVDYAIKNVGLFKCGNELLGKWLFFYLKSNLAKEYVRRSRYGTTQEYMTLDSLRKFPVFYPKNADEMRRIVVFLASIQDRIGLCTLMNKNLEAIGQALFKCWFVDFEFPNEEGKPYRSSGGKMVLSEEIGKEIPRGWEVKRLEEVTEAIFSGGTPDTRNSEYWNGTYPWLSSGETSSHFIFKTEKKITKNGIENSSTRLAKIGDIVIASAGQGKTRGQVSLCLIDSYINQSIVAIRARNDKALSSFLFLNLSLRYPELRAISDSHSIRGSLTTKLFRDLRIVLPPLETLTSFDSLLISMLEKIRSNLIESETLSSIRDSLLPKLMSGKIRVPVLKENTEAR